MSKETRRRAGQNTPPDNVVGDIMGKTAGAGSNRVADKSNGAISQMHEAPAVPTDSRVPGWPYYGALDAIQDEGFLWDPTQVVTQPRKKVAIIGFTPSRALAPYADPEYEIWGENALFIHKDVMRCTRWFDLHQPDIIDAKRISFYSQIDIPVFLQDERPDVPGSVTFPKGQIEEYVASLAPGSANKLGNYQTNSISWMIALAMWEGFTTIDVYGVDMSQDTEYAFQRPNVEYFLGMCRGLGIEVNLPGATDLLSATHQYGFGSDNGFRATLLQRRKEFEERLAMFEKEIATRRAEIQQLKIECGVINGAIQTTQWTINSWCVADHTSMKPDLAEIAPELAAATSVEVMDIKEATPETAAIQGA